MSDLSTFGYQDEEGRPAPPPPSPGAGGFPGPYKFSPEELKVVNECNVESFYQRSLPLGTMMGLSTFIAIQKGHLRPNVRFGVFPKVTLAVVMGYFIGKLSYQEKCAEKLMALPGSYIGQLLRERKEGKLTGTSMKKQPPSMFGAGPNDIYSDAGPGSSLNLDTDRPIFSDDGPRDGLPPSDAPTQSSLTYDELRRRNRGEITENKVDPYKVDSYAPPPPPRRPPPPERKPTNKYGDEMD